MALSIKRTIAWAVIITAILVFCGTIVRAAFFSPLSEIELPNSGVAATTDIPPKEQPDRLVIPKIGVDAHVQHVGIAKSGNMAVPTTYADVGWFRLGTVPGQIGSAVIDGHVDNGFGLPAVFKRLSELEEGDDVYVITKTGLRLHFKVQEIGNYAYEEVPADRLFTRGDAPRLNLITCEGTWLPKKKMYDSRRVVYTVLVDA